MVIHVVLGSFHVDCIQYGGVGDGGRGNISGLELTWDALVYFIRCVDQPLIPTCVVLGS